MRDGGNARRAANCPTLKYLDLASLLLPGLFTLKELGFRQPLNTDCVAWLHRQYRVFANGEQEYRRQRPLQLGRFHWLV